MYYSNLRAVLILFLLISFCNIHSQSLQDLESSAITLSNGWKINPVGKRITLGDLPLNIEASHSGKLLAVTNNGYSTQYIHLIDTRKQKKIDSIKISRSWLGLKFSADDKLLFASGGNDNIILIYDVLKHKLKLKDTIKLGKPWPNKISPAGIAFDDNKQILYVVTKENNSLYSIDIKTKNIIKNIDLGAEAYTCVLSALNHELYISCWGCRKLIIFNTENQIISGYVDVGEHPNDICMTKDNKILFVANAGDNSVSVIDIKTKKVIETLDAALYPNAPNGSTTNSVALSDDNKTLYIANADNNCLAVFDVSKVGNSKSKGFIPTGWYPTCVRTVNKKIYITNGKGFSSMPNPNGPNPAKKTEKVSYQGGDVAKKNKVQYIAGLFTGCMTFLSEPDEKQLSIFSQAVYKNCPYNKDKELLTEGEAGNPVPFKVGTPSPVKYVFYVIKENRTYDQVLSDIPGGNGDTTLLLFGKKYTPNQHAIANQFVLLDNFYCDGEVSADGHNWSMGAYATDYLEKVWPSSYSGRGGTYDAEGTRTIANNKNGFIWDLCSRHKVSYRTYGEFADDYKPNIPVLKDHLCKHFTSWDQKVYDTTRFYQWKQDFDSLLKINMVPQFNTIRFINDHTQGLRKDALTPFVQVADNDRAVGLLIEYISKSPIWNQCAIFIIEDDAQNGPDHVDAHRTTAYVAGGFVKRGYVDHTMYSTSSMLRTIELILGLPPMSQYDAAAMPMWRCFSKTPDTSGFVSIKPNIDLTQRNTALNKWQKMSDGFDFSMEDRCPDSLFNEVIWAAVKGENNPCPPARHSAFLKTVRSNDEDD